MCQHAPGAGPTAEKRADMLLPLGVYTRLEIYYDHTCYDPCNGRKQRECAPLDLSTHWPLFKQNLKALGRIGGLDRQRAAGKGLSG